MRSPGSTWRSSAWKAKGTCRSSTKIKRPTRDGGWFVASRSSGFVRVCSRICKREPLRGPLEEALSLLRTEIGAENPLLNALEDIFFDLFSLLKQAG